MASDDFDEALSLVDAALLGAVKRSKLVPLAAVDASGTQTFVNDAFCALVGFGADELMGARAPFAYWAPERLADIGAALERVTRGDLPPSGFELLFRRKSGETFWAKVELVPLLVGTQPPGFLASVVDVTERKLAQARVEKSREQLEEAQRLARVGSWEWDILCNQISWTDELFRIYGLDPRTFTASYEAYLELIHPEDRQLVDTHVRRAMENDKHSFHFEHRLVRPDGAVVFCESHGRVERDPNGRPVRMMGTAQDITDRKNTELVQRRLAEEQSARVVAEHAIAARDEFLSIASHELKTPLTAMSLHVQSLRVKVKTESPALIAKVDAVSRQARRLEQLMTTLLDVSRITAERIVLDVQETDFVQIVALAISELREDTGAPAIALQGPDRIVGMWDPLRLEQIAVNLISNAIKYGGGKPIRVELSQANEQALLEVEDSGIGIAPEDQVRVFERFERAISHRNISGFGIGLWIVKRVVERMGGTVSVQSKLGQGSRFSVRLPLRPE